MTVPAKGRTARSARSAEPLPDGSVRVWGEVGITVAITSDPPQYVKVTFGHERIAPDSKPATLRRYEKDIDEYNEMVVDRQAKKYARMVRAMGAD